MGQSISGNVTPAEGTSHFLYCNFEYGKTSGTEYPDINGGAVRMINSNAIFENCSFSHNSSVGGEGMGGAVYAINTGSTTEALTKFTNCEFRNNTGYSEGGAIKFTSDYNTEITNCKFINNTTSYGGGAIMFYSVVDTKMIKCLFAENSTNYDSGGALKTLGSQNTIFFKNCTIAKNSALNGSGGALALYYGSADFVNCIVYDNTSQYDDNNVYIDAGTDIGFDFIGSAPDMGYYEYGSVEYISSIEKNNIVIYPDPADNFIKLKIKNFNIQSVTIYDLTGKEVLIVKEKNTLDISDLFPGMYFLKISLANKTISGKFIKQIK